jgi:hypothetical protein
MKLDQFNILAEQYITDDSSTRLFSAGHSPSSDALKPEFKNLKGKNLAFLELRMAAEELFLPSIDTGLISTGTLPALEEKARNLILAEDHASSYLMLVIEDHAILIKLDNLNHCITVHNSGLGVGHHHQHPSKDKSLTAQTFFLNEPALSHMKDFNFNIQCEILAHCETIEDFMNN